jgi:hypothetical protein
MVGLKVFHSLTGLFVGALTLALSSPAKAANFSFSGSLSVENPVQFFSFTTNETSDVEIESFFYSGGTQADGTAVLAGGIDPSVWVFDASMSPNTYLYQIDGHGPGPGPDRVANFQSYRTLAPGNYTVALAQYTSEDNNYVFDPFAPPYVPGLNGRTDKWALDILNVDVATLISPQAVTGPKVVPVPLTSL